MSLRHGRILLLLIISNCTTSSYKITQETDSLTEILVTPDRIELECEELDEDPDVGAYGFMIHILDEQSTVTTSALAIRPDKTNCERHRQRITKILRNGKKIRIGSRSNLSKQPRTVEDARFRHTFPKHGTYPENGRSLDFVYIENEKLECYSPLKEDDEACPPFPFSKTLR